MMRFLSRREIIGKLPVYTQDQIKKEPMIFSGSVLFSYNNGGVITKDFIGKLPGGWEDCIIDSRVHMLMPTWYPCIPGWHHDDVPRTREDGQPNYDNPEYQSEHIAAVIGDASLTHFIEAPVDVDPVPLGKVIYREWHDQIEDQIRVGELSAEPITPSDVVRFDWQTFHRGAPATKSGWRMFIRASRSTNRAFINEIRTQTQVYISPVNRGW